MARTKLKKGPWAEPFKIPPIRISGPTFMDDEETGIRVGRQYLIDGVWTATRILKDRIEFQNNLTGRAEKFSKAMVAGMEEIKE